MADQVEVSENSNFRDRATLSLLKALGDDQTLSQRGLASRIGVALGLTNSLLKRAIKKGLVKVQSAPAKRYVYYITPKGFQEKSRLVAEYLETSLSFFRHAKSEFEQIFQQLKTQRRNRVVLVGEGELADIALLAARDQEIAVTSIFISGSNQSTSHGLSVVSNYLDLVDQDYDAFILTSMDGSQEVYDQLAKHVDPSKIHVAPLFNIVVPSKEEMEA